MSQTPATAAPALPAAAPAAPTVRPQVEQQNPQQRPPRGDVSAAPGRRYVLISPCRDEQAYMETTLRSVSEQSEPPALWIVVDDGSSDRTPEILEDWARRLPYLHIVRREDRGHRKVGSGVMDAFYAGLEHVDLDEFDYVCKLDLDLDLPERYFELVMDQMATDPRLAVFSGKPYFWHDGGLLGRRQLRETCGDENAVGMAKFYRINAFRQIGMFVRELMWDGIDGHRCRMHGWRAESRDDPELQFIHLRPMGTSHKGWWTGRARHGRGQYFMGTGPVYILASAIYRMAHPPLIIGGLAMLWGYFSTWLGGEPRYDEKHSQPEFRRFLRRYQRLCLLKGKQRATQQVDAEQASLFTPMSDSAAAPRGVVTGSAIS